MQTHSKQLESKVIELVRKKSEDQSTLAVFETFIQENHILVDTVIADGCTVLHVFTTNGMAHFVRRVLTMNVNVNATNDAGDTPLHIAVRAGKTTVVKLLFKNKLNSIYQTKRRKLWNK